MGLTEEGLCLRREKGVLDLRLTEFGKDRDGHLEACDSGRRKRRRRRCPSSKMYFCYQIAMFVYSLTVYS